VERLLPEREHLVELKAADNDRPDRDCPAHP
jgi:hypothetical protein